MIATLLGGPLAGGYLLAKNFKAIDKAEKTAQAWFIAILAFLGLILLAVFIPVPRFAFIFLYAWMGYFAADKLQGNFLDSHEEEGGKFHSNWTAAGIGALIAVIFLALLLGAWAIAVVTA